MTLRAQPKQLSKNMFFIYNVYKYLFAWGATEYMIPIAIPKIILQGILLSTWPKSSFTRYISTVFRFYVLLTTLLSVKIIHFLCLRLSWVIKQFILLQHELPVCLPIFLERLRNEITRLTTVKALTKVASSPLRIDLTPILVRNLS